MPQDPSRLSERREPVRARNLRGIVVVAALALAGCAAVPTPRPHAARDARAADRSESSAAPSRPRGAEPAPPESSAEPAPVRPAPRVMIVKASAYNSRRGQTDATPSIGAWGDRLVPGMRVIAVSRDLLELGLRRGKRVRIAGLSGEFIVLDRMPSRWRQKIDIYMGHDVRAALRWGVRDVEISWIPDDETSIGRRSAPPGDSSGLPDPDVASEVD